MWSGWLEVKVARARNGSNAAAVERPAWQYGNGWDSLLGLTGRKFGAQLQLGMGAEWLEDYHEKLSNILEQARGNSGDKWQSLVVTNGRWICVWLSVSVVEAEQFVSVCLGVRDAVGCRADEQTNRRPR